MKHKSRKGYQIKIVSVVAAAVISIIFLFLSMNAQIEQDRQLILENWRAWQKTILQNAVDEARLNSGENIEDYILNTAIQKLKQNESDYVVFYGDNKVIYENNNALTSESFGLNIRDLYGKYSYAGGYHLQEVLEPMEEGRSGADYFVKSHSKGPELITWISFRFNQKTYVLGVVSGERYVLRLYHFNDGIHFKYALAYIYTFLIILFSGIICFDSYRHHVMLDHWNQREGELVHVNTRVKQSLAELEDNFEKLSITDFLTGLYNRKFFDVFFPKLESEIFLPISIAIIDIDGLKLINNTFGYQKGDEILIGVANAITSVCDPDDIIARYGTDEFAIVMINLSYEEALHKLYEISGFVSDQYAEFKVSISFGSAVRATLKDDIFDTLELAEQRLQINKFTANKSIQDGSVSMLKNILHERTSETVDHCERLEKYAVMLANALGMDENKIHELSTLAFLHDVGKISISDTILNKGDALTDEEYEIMKTHTVKGYNIAMASPNLRMIAKPILQHHERWDGKGYPHGISGEDIMLEARIIAVIDAFDTMVNMRAYKDASSVDEALDEIERCAGTQFDSNIAKIFVKLMREKGEKF